MGTPRTPHDLLHHLTIALSGLATSFTRLRRWSPRSIVVAVLLLTRPDQRTSYASMLTGLADETCRWLGLASAPTRSSLSVARRKVPVESFRQVLHQLVDHVGALLPGELKDFGGERRFIAVDATSLVCPSTPSLLKSLDRPHWSSWLMAHYPRAMVVVAFDVVRRLPLEWVLLAKGTGERAAVEPLIKRFRSGDVIIMDRGYPSRAVLASLVRSGMDVVMRMTAGKAGAWPEVKKFLDSGQKTAVIEYSWEKGKTVSIRLIRRNPPPGRPLKHQKRETMIVLTTLLPKHGFEAKDILDIYGKRWDIESLFREMKEAFGIERFHARTLDGIQQEIATVLMWTALIAVIHGAVQDGLSDGKRANRTVSREVARICLLSAIEGRMPDIPRFITEARRHSYKPRTGRSFPRVSKIPYGRFRNRSATK